MERREIFNMISPGHDQYFWKKKKNHSLALRGRMNGYWFVEGKVKAVGLRQLCLRSNEAQIISSDTPAWDLRDGEKKE